jgi:sulfur transfer complex TusBCD TusB component (DsrH family)
MVIIEKERLIKIVNEPLFALRENLVGRGYTEDEADKAIAGALPNCIAMAVIKRGKEVI